MRTLLKGGTVLDLVGEKAIPGVVAFEHGRLTAVGSDVVEQPDDEVVDVSGKYLLPGFFNCHAHLGWDGVRDLQAQSEDPEEISAWRAAMNVRKSLAAGVTTVRDLGMNSAGIYAKRAIDEGIAPWLRLFIVGRALSITGGHTWWCCREADGVDDCRKAVREQAKAGATWIKIMGSHELPQFTMQELEAIVDEAHQDGLRVTAHATFDEAISRVVRAGVDSVEHGGSVSQPTIDMMLERGTVIVTTFSPLFLQAERGLAHGMPAWEVERRQRQIDEGARFEGNRAATLAGIPVAFGTDAGSALVPHNEIAPELGFMVRVGASATPWSALRSLTIRAAELLGVADDLGTLEVGKAADVVVLGANPADDLAAAAQVERVYVRGALAVSAGSGYGQKA